MKKIFAVFGFLLLLTACTSTKEIAYFQDTLQESTTNVAPRLIKFRPQDKLSILVNTRNQELTNMFNLAYVTKQIGMSSTSVTTPQGITCYTIDNEGFIDFPILGKVKVAGMTRAQIAEHIKKELTEKNLVKDAIVTVEFANLTYSVLGEVKNPNRYAITNDQVTLLEAISQAGDLTIQGQRTNVKVLRSEPDGKQTTYIVNLCSLEQLQSSPAFYLQQNDVIYVEPNDMRARQSTVNGNNVRSSSFWISLASLFASIINIMIR